MKRNPMAALMAVLLVFSAAGPASAQAFFPSKVKGTFSVTFTTNAPGSTLVVDGQPAGVLPTTIWVVAGRHTFTLTAPGQVPQVISQPVMGNLEIPFMVQQAFFPLTINTNVPGAALSLDGAPLASNRTQAMAGAHTVTVSAPGYLPLTIPYTQPAGPHILNVTLMAATGTVQLNLDRIIPAGAGYKLYVNGNEARGTTQVLPGGTYSFRIVWGNQSLETTVAVTAGQVLTVTPSIQWDQR